MLIVNKQKNKYWNCKNVIVTATLTYGEFGDAIGRSVGGGGAGGGIDSPPAYQHSFICILLYNKVQLILLNDWLLQIALKQFIIQGVPEKIAQSYKV